MSTKNKLRARLALAELEKEMELLTEEQMNACKGGLDGLTGFSGNYDNSSGGYQQNPCKPSCVFNVFDYLDGDRHDTCHYYNETKKNLNVVPDANGGIDMKHFSTIADYGGFEVKKIEGNPILYGSIGCSFPNNNDVVMIIRKRGIGHAVIVQGVEYVSGVTRIKYHDPTEDKIGYVEGNKYVEMYEVFEKN